ncbi:MAG TPA: protein kinase [Gemmataceae bacterium]|jgi:serine/threonine protein kinase|nr:protein kinase [Gemmataceae bacterium]
MQPARTPADRRAADIIQSWLDGVAPPDANAALAQHPDFAADKALVLDLAFAEFLLREHKGEQLDIEAFCARFPDYHASLGRMLAQQSIAERLPPGLEAIVSGGLAGTLNVEIDVVSGTNSNPAPQSPRRTDGPIASPAGTQAASSGSSGRPSSNSGWPEPGSRVGDFSLLRQLGKGAFGRVFLAIEEPTTKHVVVKISKQKCDEAKVLGRLGHRNVVSVLSAPHDVASGLYLIVMPYLGSATLEDLLEVAYPLRKSGVLRARRADLILTAARRNLRSDDPAPTDQKADPFLTRAGFVDGIVWLGIRIADALAAVHQCGFVHHDLKPSNVLLGADGQPRVLDFNLASDVRNLKSRLGGTLPYMPPEHLQAVRQPNTPSEMDSRGDVYSLGVILYELLCGTHPFGRFPKARSVRTAANDMLERQKQGVRPIRERNPEIPHRLARFVERCLAFAPADRPPTAAAVAAELRQCYSIKKRALQFFGSRPRRVAVTAATVGLVSAVTWLASAQARPLPPDHRLIGLTAAADGKYEVAIPELLQATQDNPRDAEAFLNLGRARLAQKELLAARPNLEQAAALRHGHGQSEATLAWCFAMLGESAPAIEHCHRAEDAGYAPAALYAVEAYAHIQVRDDQRAAAAIAKALVIDPNNRAALVSRANLALIVAMENVAVPPMQAFNDVERALQVGPADGYLELWAAQFYTWAAHKPPQAKGDWYPDQDAAKTRCLTLLRQAVKHGISEINWRQDSTFTFLFGDPTKYSRDWVKPTVEADMAGYWRVGNPLVEFGDRAR